MSKNHNVGIFWQKKIVGSNPYVSIFWQKVVGSNPDVTIFWQKSPDFDSYQVSQEVLDRNLAKNLC